MIRILLFLLISHIAIGQITVIDLPRYKTTLEYAIPDLRPNLSEIVYYGDTYSFHPGDSTGVTINIYPDSLIKRAVLIYIDTAQIEINIIRTEPVDYSHKEYYYDSDIRWMMGYVILGPSAPYDPYMDADKKDLDDRIMVISYKLIE